MRGDAEGVVVVARVRVESGGDGCGWSDLWTVTRASAGSWS